MMQSIELDSNEESIEEGDGVGESIAWRVFSKSKKSKQIKEDSVLYPILKNLDQDHIVLSDLNFDQIKIIFKGISDTDVFQGFYTAFRAVAWPMWWFGTGFISPGAIMFLGLFLLKLAIFATAVVSTAFLVLSTAFGLLNIVSNLFLNARNAVYAQVASDLKLLQDMINEVDLYLERHDYAAHWSEKHVGENANELKELGGDISDERRIEYENKFYLSLKYSVYSIDNYINTNWYLRSPLMKVLNVINNVFNAINTRVLFGFGCFIFVMMTINIFFPLSMPIILTVIALASLTCIIHTGLVIRDINAVENTHATNLASVKEKLRELDHKLDDFQDTVPKIKFLNEYDTTIHKVVDFEHENEAEAEHSEDESELKDEDKTGFNNPKLKSYLLEPSQYEREGSYKPRFIGSLSEVVQKATLSPDVLDDFVNYAADAPTP